MSEDSLFNQGQDLFNEKKYNEVINLLPDTVLDSMKSARLYAIRAWAYYRLKEMKFAYDDANKSIFIDPSNAIAYRVRGNVWGDKKEFEKAIDDYNKAININPTDSISYTNRGNVWRRKKSYDNAIQDTSKAIDLAPSNAIAYRIRGLTWYDMEEYDKAIDDYTKAISYDPIDYYSFYNRGITWYDKGEYDKAIDDYTQAIKLNPKSEEAFCNRGVVWNKKQEYDKAIQDYTEAIALNPNEPDFFYNRGLTWNNKKENDKAIQDYTEAIKIDPSKSMAYHNRGSSWYDKQEYEKAIEDYEMAIGLGLKEAEYWRDRALEKKQEQDEIKLLASFGHNKDLLVLSKELDTIIEKILKISISGRHETTVHYTKLFVADKMLARDEKTDKNKQGKLRYYNAIYMNDPTEGDYIFDCFNKKEKIKKAFDKGKSITEMSVYLGSFLVNNDKDHEDELLMWRTYGKDEKQIEAAGCSMVIAEIFFDKHDESQLMAETDTSKTTAINGALPQGLYKVIYSKNRRYLHDPNKDIWNAMIALEKILIKMIAIQEKGKKEVQDLIDGIIFKRLSHICYLFKSSDYAYENEVRVIQYMPRDSDLIQLDESFPPKLYVPSNKQLLPYLKKIYVGPKAENAEHWMSYLDFKIRQLNKFDKEELKKLSIEKYDLNVFRSTCMFR